jgi:hypothetical protein
LPLPPLLLLLLLPFAFCLPQPGRRCSRSDAAAQALVPPLAPGAQNPDLWAFFAVFIPFPDPIFAPHFPSGFPFEAFSTI